MRAKAVSETAPEIKGNAFKGRAEAVANQLVPPAAEDGAAAIALDQEFFIVKLPVAEDKNNRFALHRVSAGRINHFQTN